MVIMVATEAVQVAEMEAAEAEEVSKVAEIMVGMRAATWVAKAGEAGGEEVCQRWPSWWVCL
jgi:hypothetical protein